MLANELKLFAIGEVEKWAFAVCRSLNDEARDIAIKRLGKALKDLETVEKLIGEKLL